jgi:hypothetical protein
MNVELSKEDLMLIDMLLSKEESMTRVEIHHCFSHDYKNFLKEREKHIGDLLTRVKDALTTIKE